MYRMLKQRIVGTPLEPMARALARFVRRPTANDAVAELNRRYDAQAETVMQRVLDSTSNCVDVGCHKGSILELMRRFAPKGEIHAFEPLPHLFAGLREKYGSVEGIHLHEAALSDAPGTTVFNHVVAAPALSGLRTRDYGAISGPIEKIDVELLRLDDVVPNGYDVRLIKIDVEGAELQVLRGSVETLARCRPYVIFEHGLGGADHYGTRPETVHDLLTAAGLHIALMGDWLEAPDAAGMSREAFIEQFDRGLNFYFMAYP